MKSIFVFFIAFQLVGCISTNKMQPQRDEINLQPMYGGFEKTPQQKQCDDAFIQSVIRKMGDRRKGSLQISQLGWSYLQKGDWKTAMRRFNQAWLLDPDNHETYWGFGAILNRQQKYIEANEMGEKALSLAADNHKIMCDVAFGYGNYANSINNNTEEREKYFQKAFALYRKAMRIDPEYSCIYNHWAITLYYYGEYQTAWEKVKKSEELGVGFQPSFLNDLANKMPRPDSS